MKNDIYNYTLEELSEYFKTIGEKPFRATQVFEWLYRNRVTSFKDMTNISQKLITKLEDEFEIKQLEIVTKQVSKDGTTKYLFRLEDNKLIETVLMRHNYGNSVCVTSEVGCNMGCVFCASGELGKVRNLTLGEMVLQVLMVQRDLDENYQRVSNIVVMGIGEPFDNYETVLKFLQVVNYAKGLEIGARHITVSTCGIVPKIKEFANFPLQINLAISLHAPNDEIRNKIMPINKVYSISQVIDTIKEYILKTNRRVTIEYVMLNNVNDSVSNAYELAKLLKGMNVYVNLIPYNETSHLEFRKSRKEQINKFFDCLKREGINVTVRREFGSKIDAACGQLRSKEEA